MGRAQDSAFCQREELEQRDDRGSEGKAHRHPRRDESAQQELDRRKAAVGHLDQNAADAFAQPAQLSLAPSASVRRSGDPSHALGHCPGSRLASVDRVAGEGAWEAAHADVAED